MFDAGDATAAQRLLEAIEFAAERHASGRRKGSSQRPYINHPITVARLLACEAGLGDDVELLLAGVLHDTVEDTETDSKELEARFGSEVAAVVREVSDDKSLPQAERKRLQVEHAPHLSSRAKLVKLADKISNVRDMCQDPPDWSLERRQGYVSWAERVVAGIRGVSPRLEAVFDETVARARASLS